MARAQLASFEATWAHRAPATFGPPSPPYNVMFANFAKYPAGEVRTAWARSSVYNIISTNGNPSRFGGYVREKVGSDISS